MQYVTVFDPSGDRVLGEVVDGAARIFKSRSKSVVMLPTDPFVQFSASPGFVYRPWGLGWNFDALKAERGCPMMIGVAPEHPWIYWAARIAPIRPDEAISGTIRLIANGSAGGMGMGMSQDMVVPKLETLPSSDVVVTGRCSLGVTVAGVLGLSIYGCAMNAKVLWSAVSLAAEKVDLIDVVAV